ncbi:hypothetical protein ACISU4_00530 [Streptomyces wuyuanensis]|uniref:hypothetical protein n=1 Tax=Streptomyces wuyuanensis TaxID=1196353 RepID=UPI003829C34E
MTTAPNPEPSTSVRFLSVAIALLVGTVAALAAYIAADHLGAPQLEAVKWAGGAFVATTYLAFKIKESVS